jgi:DNA-binding MarR family transcriptional regulator
MFLTYLRNSGAIDFMPPGNFEATAMSPTQPTVTRLLNMLRALRELSSFSDLTADEEQLLFDLVLRWHRNDAITVSDVMLDAERTSASTIYRRLLGLKEKGMVAFRVDQRDKRVKFVEPTAKADDYVQRLSRSVDQLVEGSQAA